MSLCAFIVPVARTGLQSSMCALVTHEVPPQPNHDTNPAPHEDGRLDASILGSQRNIRSTICPHKLELTFCGRLLPGKLDSRSWHSLRRNLAPGFGESLVERMFVHLFPQSLAIAIGKAGHTLQKYSGLMKWTIRFWLKHLTTKAYTSEQGNVLEGLNVHLQWKIGQCPG